MKVKEAVTKMLNRKSPFYSPGHYLQYKNVFRNFIGSSDNPISVSTGQLSGSSSLEPSHLPHFRKWTRTIICSWYSDIRQAQLFIGICIKIKFFLMEYLYYAFFQFSKPTFLLEKRYIVQYLMNRVSIEIIPSYNLVEQSFAFSLTYYHPLYHRW